MKVIDKGSITVTGITSDGKWSGVLLSQDSVLYYLEDGIYWEKKYMNKSVTVSGELRLEKRKYRVEKNESGEIIYSAVLPKHMFIITPFSITPIE
ncbi:MAG: hypothetical protein MK105_18140 [Crocinitomicaceae bacterium]|nr:hypothetical protein [Crocinitomicaceae bacterium]